MTYGVCDVCDLVDGDRAEKRTRYCSVCDANICDRCWWNPARRTRALALRALRKMKGRE